MGQSSNLVIVIRNRKIIEYFKKALVCERSAYFKNNKIATNARSKCHRFEAFQKRV